MNFKEALEFLQDMYPGQYQSLTYSVSTAENGTIDQVCQLWLVHKDGVGKLYTGETWELAFKALETRNAPLPIDNSI